MKIIFLHFICFQLAFCSRNRNNQISQDRCTYQEIQLDEIHPEFIAEGKFNSFSQLLFEIVHRDGKQNKIFDLSAMIFEVARKQEQISRTNLEDNKWEVTLQFGKEKYKISEDKFTNIHIYEIELSSSMNKVSDEHLEIKLINYFNYIPSFILYNCRKSRQLIGGVNKCKCFPSVLQPTPKKCEDEFYQQLPAVNLCIPCPINCHECKAQSTNNLSCNLCNEGYFKQYPSLECDSCLTGYYSYIDGLTLKIKCAKCPYGCQSCQLVDNNLVCQSCNVGYTNAQSLCNTCIEGYSNSNTVSSDYAVCTKCPINCQVCSSNGRAASCSSCHTGYNIDTFECNSCIDGYYQSTDPDNITCTQCPKKCKICNLLDTTITCTTCYDGYSERDSKCNMCAEGYFISNVGKTDVTCAKCPTNCNNCELISNLSCFTCNSDGENSIKSCNSCIEGYYNSNNQVTDSALCTKCPTNCLNCEKTSSGKVNCITCNSDFHNVDGVCSFCDIGYYNTDSGTSSGKASCKQCDMTCLTCNGSSSADCIKCQDTYQKSTLESICMSSEQIQSQINEYNNIRNNDCEWKDRVACQSKLEFSQKTANLNSNLGTAGVSIGGVAGVFLPHVSTSLWLFIQNQQLIGNNVLQSKFKKMGLSKNHLSNSRSFNLFGMMPPFYGQSKKMFKDKDYYSAEVSQSNSQSQGRFLNQIQEIKPLFIENCLGECILIIGVFLLTPVIFLLGKMNILFQHIYVYMKWNLLIRVFMLTFNSVSIYMIYSFKNNLEFNSSTESYSTAEKTMSVIILISVALIWLQLQIQIGYYCLFQKEQLDQQSRAKFEVLFMNTNEKGGISSMFWILYSIKNIFQCVVLCIYDQGVALNYWIFFGLDLALFLYLIIFDALRPKHLRIFVCCQQAFQAVFNLLLALITMESDEDNIYLFTKIFIILTSILNGLMVLSSVVWAIHWIFQIFVAKKRQKLASSCNQTQIIGHELSYNIDDILNNSLSNSFRKKQIEISSSN